MREAGKWQTSVDLGLGEDEVPNEVFKLKKIVDLNNPWSFTFINEKEVLVSDKDGKIELINIKNGLKQIVQHNLNYKVDGQGGLLEILKNKEDIYICYTSSSGIKTNKNIDKEEQNDTDIEDPADKPVNDE